MADNDNAGDKVGNGLVQHANATSPRIDILDEAQAAPVAAGANWPRRGHEMRKQYVIIKTVNAPIGPAAS